jgi:hypothetical protein
VRDQQHDHATRDPIGRAWSRCSKIWSDFSRHTGVNIEELRGSASAFANHHESASFVELNSGQPKVFCSEVDLPDMINRDMVMNDRLNQPLAKPTTSMLG